MSVATFVTPEELAAGILRAREQCDALFAIVFLDQLAVFFDQRYSAGLGATTPDQSQPACEAFRFAKRLAIQHGMEGADVPQPRGLIYSRADFVNEYWRPTADEPRLDFQYYEHDLNEFTRVVVESYSFTKSFYAATGYTPKAWATFFVNRLDQAKKPFGLYSGGPGTSFSFDPCSSNPIEPRWQRFAREYNKVAISRLGGNASPIQTQWLERADIGIPAKLARTRFTTKYYDQFPVR